MIIRARSIVTMDGPPRDNGAVALEGDRIIDVGSFDELRARHSGEVLDLGERALLPGLINAHCHLDYSCLRGKIRPQTSFTDWVRAINAEKAALSPNDYERSINDGFAEAARFGTTTIVNLTAFPELIAQINPPIRCFWFPELIDVREPVDIEGAIARVRAGRNGGLAPHAPFTASPALYRRCEAAADLLTTHLAESADEMEMFRDARGPLYDFLKAIGRNMRDCGGTTPVQFFLRCCDGPSYHNWLIAHLNELAESDFDFLAGSTSKFHVVHCPRSHAYFGHAPFQFSRLRRLGFDVSLGTDSLASNHDLSLFGEMRAFQKHFPEVRPEEILEMVTIRPARALRRKHRLGVLRPGACADLIGLPFSGGDVFEAIVGFEGEPWGMTEGLQTGRN